MGYCVKNKVAIVTGSAKGFGKEFAVRLLENGAKVCLSDVDEQTGDETKVERSNSLSMYFCFIYDMNIIDNTPNISFKNGKVTVFAANPEIA